LTFRTTI